MIEKLHSGDIRTITAHTPETGHEFDVWDGDIYVLDDAHANPATVTMPNSNATLTALYRLLSVGGYGALCNWFCTQGTGDASLTSSDDWVVPSQAQWEDLLNSIDDYDSDSGAWLYAGGKLKEIGFTHWDSPNEGATDEYAFHLKGTGIRDDIGGGEYGFENIKTSTYLWASEISDETSAKVAQFEFADAQSAMSSDSNNDGASIRLCNTSTTHENGYVGTYTGNNGTVYNTIVINGVEWLSQNLNETKFRNGDWIHGFDGGVYTPISNEDWAELTEPAMCYYLDDLTNA
jgi:uncharacterized protein (TIGR02145 family)